MTVMHLNVSMAPLDYAFTIHYATTTSHKIGCESFNEGEFIFEMKGSKLWDLNDYDLVERWNEDSKER